MNKEEQKLITTSVKNPITGRSYVFSSYSPEEVGKRITELSKTAISGEDVLRSLYEGSSIDAVAKISILGYRGLGGVFLDSELSTECPLLTFAVSYDCPETVATLLQNGANANVLDKDGNSPLCVAEAYMVSESVVSILKEFGAKKISAKGMEHEENKEKVA